MLGLKNDFFSSNISVYPISELFPFVALHESSHGVLMGQLSLDNENMNVAETGQVLYDKRAYTR